MLKWRLMRKAEKKRNNRQKTYTRYKNNFFLDLVVEATKVRYWTDWDMTRLKKLRTLIEHNYDIPINFYSAFIYYATYKYMHWKHKRRDFGNYVGFISNESMLVQFANYACSKNMLWRKKNTRWPEDYHDRWGIKTSVKGQRLGFKDKVVKHDIHSNNVGRRINKHL